MGKPLFHRMFQDLLSLHGYPLPFESIERITGASETPDYRRGYGNRDASARAFRGPGRKPGRAQAAAGHACATGGCV